MYRTMGRVHAGVHQLLQDLARDQRGQGTVEYVGLILLMAVVIGAVVSAGKGADVKEIPGAITDKLKGAIDGVGSGK